MDDSSRRTRRRTLKRGLLSAAAIAALAASLTACAKADAGGGSPSSGPASFSSAAQQAASPITVWVDSTRLPGVQAYQKSHPNVKMKIVTYSGDANGASDLQTKIELYNRAGSGWPDVVFSEEYNDATWSTAANIDWLAPLSNGLVPKATLDGFATNSLAPCTVDGTVYCLRNDIGQNVVWYNTKLMKQFGYQVPTTWQQYQELGAKVAKQHPGYVIGTVGDSYTPEVYFWASQCPANQADGNTVTVDTSGPNCTRMAKLLDAGVANKSISTLAAFSSDFTKKYGHKVLMLVGPSWYGQYVFNSALKVPAGQVAAAPPLTWGGSAPAATGDVGGAIWMVSKHSKNLAAATALATYMATNNGYQVTAPTYPAYKPAAAAWLANQAKSGYFAGDVSSTFQQAASEVWSGWSATKYSQEAIWAASMAPQIANGKTISSLLGTWETAIKHQATSLGYTVK